MSQSWLVSVYRHCAKSKVNIDGPGAPAEKLAAFEAAAKRGDIGWQQAPALVDRARGLFTYRSPLVAAVVASASGVHPPKGAPPLFSRKDLPTLDAEEFKEALRYRIYLIGAGESGKSSVQKCVCADKTPTFKKIPAVESPTVAASASGVVALEKVKDAKKKGGAILTHYEVWDTPSDPSFAAALPLGFFAARGSCCFICYRADREPREEEGKVEEALRQVADNSPAPASRAAEKVPVVLFATRRDAVGNAKAAERLAEVVRWRLCSWFGALPLARTRFTLLGAYACSCKDWGLQGEMGKDGPTSFPQAMRPGLRAAPPAVCKRHSRVPASSGEDAARHLGRQLHKLYPLTPPALLGEEGRDAGLHFDMARSKAVAGRISSDLSGRSRACRQHGDWWDAARRAHLAESTAPQQGGGEGGRRGVVALCVAIDRLRRRGCCAP
eukprot:gene14360-17663_t